MFLIDMKFTSKFFSILLMEILSFVNPHLHENIFEIHIQNIYIKHISKNKFQTKRLISKKTTTLCFKNGWCICTKNRKFSNFQILVYENKILKDASIFSCIFLAIWVIVRRVTGPDFDQTFEAPKII